MSQDNQPRGSRTESVVQLHTKPTLQLRGSRVAWCARYVDVAAIHPFSGSLSSQPPPHPLFCFFSKNRVTLPIMHFYLSIGRKGEHLFLTQQSHRHKRKQVVESGRGSLDRTRCPRQFLRQIKVLYECESTRDLLDLPRCHEL